MNNNKNQNDHYEKLLETILSKDTFDELRTSLNSLYPAKIGDLLESLPENKRYDVWKLVNPSLKGEVLLEVHESIRKELIEKTSDSELTNALKRLQLDELVDLEDELPHKVIDSILATLTPKKRKQFKMMREYPSESAGGLMDMDAITIRSDISLKVVLRYLRSYRKAKSGLPEHLDSIIVVDRDNHYLGVLPLKDLVSFPENRKVEAIMNKEVKPVLNHLDE